MKQENIIQYFIFTSNQKSACLEVSNCKLTTTGVVIIGRCKWILDAGNIIYYF